MYYFKSGVKIRLINGSAILEGRLELKDEMKGELVKGEL